MLLNTRTLNTSPLNAVGSEEVPPVEDAVVLLPPSLVARARLGSPSAGVSVLLELPPLVARARWGGAAVEQAALTLALPSLKGGRLGGASVALVLHANSLKQPMRLGGAALQAVFTPSSLVSRLQFGGAQVAAVQRAQSLVGRMVWGELALSSVIYPPSLRGGRLGGAALQSITVIAVDFSFGPMRWGGHTCGVGTHPLPVSSRARLGRPVVEWGLPCQC